VATYWRPVCKYLRAGRGLNAQDAEDLTQEFFARAFTKDTLASYDPSKARFRTFLRVCLDRMALNAVKAEQRLKRGGGQIESLDSNPAAADGLTDPEDFFRREWIRSLFDSALADTSKVCRAQGKETALAVFMGYDIEPPTDSGRPSYAELAQRHDVPVTQITNYLSLVRRIFRRAVLDRLRAVTATEEEFAAEAREILGVEV
jgi:RNA polymerase sigma factor (sigma-70 family)